MISINSRRLAISLTACAALTLPALAQKTFTFPHVLEREGRIVAIGWDLDGGQLEFVLGADASGAPIVLRQYRPIGALYSLYGNDEVFEMLRHSLGNNENWPFGGYSMYPVRKTGSGRIHIDAPFINLNRVAFPGCDVNSKEPAGVEIYFNPKELKFERTMDGAEVKGGFEASKKQKMWTPANFRFTIDGLPTARVMRSRQLQVTVTGQPQHGRVFLVSDSEITIPLSDAPAYREKLLATMKGAPGDLNFQLDYLDEDGNVLLSLRSVVQIVSVDKEDPFDPFDPADSANADKPVKVALKHTKGHVTLFR